MIENLSPKHLGSRIQNSSSIKIIDVRTPAEFDEIHIQNAENIPLDQLNASTLNLNSGEMDSCTLSASLEAAAAEPAKQ